MSSEKLHVEHCKGVNGLDKVILREAGRFSAEVYLYGGQVTSWTNVRGEQLLFLSWKAPFNPPVAIRGGIPICFPDFESIGSVGRHGFARNRTWSVDKDPPPFPSNTSYRTFVDLILRHSEQDANIWPHRYECRLRVALGPGGRLMLTSRIRNTNTNGSSFTFKFAYHNFFFVSEISDVRVEGLETLHYLDFQKNREQFTEQADALTFESEVDKVYLNTPTKIAILDHLRRRTIVLRKSGLPDAVVWNPWDKKMKAMPDFDKNDYKYMLCLGVGCLEKPITLKPGEEWTGLMELSVVASSYYSGELDPKKVATH